MSRYGNLGVPLQTLSKTDKLTLIQLLVSSLDDVTAIVKC